MILAAIRRNRQLDAIGEDGALRWSTGATPGLVWGAWSGADDADQALYSWPTWSPSGDRLAAFRAPTSGQSPELVLLHGDGVRTEVLFQLGEQIPIYAQWSPDGTHLAVLAQVGDRLALTVVPTSGEPVIELAQGSPLFFTWADADHLALFHGDGKEVAIGLMRRTGGKLDRFPGIPGHFCAPIPVERRIGYVAHHSGRLSLWLADRTAARELEQVDGLVAALPRPGGGAIARAIAEDERSPYRRLARIDLADGSVTPLDDEPLTAFFWAPNGEWIVICRTDRGTGWVGIDCLDARDGTAWHLGDVRPTRDLRFYLRFFEQFAQSHPLIDPDSRAVVIPGELAQRDNLAGLWSLPLDGGDPTRLGDGLLAVWSPVPPSDAHSR